MVQASFRRRRTQPIVKHEFVFVVTKYRFIQNLDINPFVFVLQHKPRSLPQISLQMSSLLFSKAILCSRVFLFFSLVLKNPISGILFLNLHSYT